MEVADFKECEEVKFSIHDHFYRQTMYFLAGKTECWRFYPDTEDIIEKRITGPGYFVYSPVWRCME